MKKDANNFVTYPVLDEIKADAAFPTTEEWGGETVRIPAEEIAQDPDNYFVLKVKDGSMYPQFQKGDKVLVLKQSTTDYSGQVAAVVYGDETAMLRKAEYRKGEDLVCLMPTEPNSVSVKIEDSNLDKFHILGIPKLLLYRGL